MVRMLWAFDTLNVHRGGSGSTAGTATASSHCTRRLDGRRFDTLPRSVEESLGRIGRRNCSVAHGKRRGAKKVGLWSHPFGDCPQARGR